MGSLTLPAASVIYLDTPPFIYTVEKHKDFFPYMYEQTLTASDVRLITVAEDLFRQAARLRAQTNLKTPDAIHASTALASDCVQFLGLNVVVLSELL